MLDRRARLAQCACNVQIDHAVGRHNDDLGARNLPKGQCSASRPSLQRRALCVVEKDREIVKLGTIGESYGLFWSASLASGSLLQNHPMA